MIAILFCEIEIQNSLIVSFNTFNGFGYIRSNRLFGGNNGLQTAEAKALETIMQISKIHDTGIEDHIQHSNRFFITDTAGLERQVIVCRFDDLP